MKLSASILSLKRQAKLLAREAKIPLHKALDRIAAKEGFNSWSLLAARASRNSPSNALLADLKPGDMVLLGARPGQGKTLLGLELMLDAVNVGNGGVFFTLEYTEADVLKLLDPTCGDTQVPRDSFYLDTSDAICADYIIDQLGSASDGTLVVIDYLQLLDQRRQNPPLAAQVTALKAFAQEKNLIIVFIAQIDRSFELLEKPVPDITDVRLPNPLDMKLFNKTCFLGGGETHIGTTS